MAGLDALPWQMRVGNATIGYVAYLWKTVWPTHLAAFYPLFDDRPRRASPSPPRVLIAVTVASIRCARAPSVSVGRLVLVRRHDRARDRLAAGGRAGDGRSVHVRADDRHPADRVAWGVLTLARTARRRGRMARARLRSRSSSACRRSRRAAQAAHWEDSVDAVGARGPGHARELHRAREPRAGAARARAARRGEGQLRAGARPRAGALARLCRGDQQQHRDGADAAGADGRGAASNSPRRCSGIPAFAEAQSNLGNALAADGRLRRGDRALSRGGSAEAGLHRAARRSRRRAAAARERGRARCRTIARRSRWIRTWRRPTTVSAARWRRRGTTTRRWPSTREALRLKPDLPTAHLNIALLLIKKGDVAQARRHLEDGRCRSIPATRPRSRRCGRSP